MLEDILHEGAAAAALPDAHGGEAARLLGLREVVQELDGLEVLRGAVQREAIQVRVRNVRKKVSGKS